MTTPLQHLMAELEQFGATNDAAIAERAGRMLNITRDTGQFLAVLVRATGARRVLEIGTSNGYSTLWLADAARAIGGHVTTLELSEFKVALAAANFTRSGLSPFITQHRREAGQYLANAAEASVDLIFLDSERSEYANWWPSLKHVLRPGGTLVVDNATSHADQLAPLVALAQDDPAFTCCLVPIGNGEFVATRADA